MKCENCNLEMLKVKLCTDTYGAEPYVALKEKGIFKSEIRSKVESYMCPQCGSIKLKASNPELFKNRFL